MMSRLSHPLMIVLTLIGAIGCSYTPKVAYDPILIDATTTSRTAAHAPRIRENADAGEKQGWSVITDPVVLDAEGMGYEDDLAEAEDADIYVDYDDYSYSNFTPYPDDEINYRVSDFYYDTYIPESYPPIRYVYSYYTPSYYSPYYRPFTWYYGEYVNHPYEYPSNYSAFVNYYDPWRYGPYGSAMFAYGDYPYYTTFYSGYGYYPGYYWSPLDYYNPFWTYSWNDYWGGYYASPYLYHHGYDPFYAYGKPWRRYGYPWNRYHGWNYDGDHKEDGAEKPTDGGGQREGRPMISQRNEEIRLTSSSATGGVGMGEDRSITLPNLKSSRSNSLSSDRDRSTSETTRSSRRSLEREKERSIQVWSLPPLRTETMTQKTNPSYLRDQNMGQTIRTSRKDGDSSSGQTAPKITQESQRQSTKQSWNSQSPASRISVWRNQRSLSPSQPSENSRSTIIVQPSERRSSNSIRVYQPQSQTRYQRIDSSNLRTNRYSTDRSQQNYNASTTRSFLQPIPRSSEPSVESPRTNSSYLREPASRSTTPSSLQRTYTITPQTSTSPSRSFQQSSSENYRTNSITIPRSQPLRSSTSNSTRINNSRSISPSSSLSTQRSSSTYSAPARSMRSSSISIPRSSSSNSIPRSSVAPSRSISTPSRAPSRSISAPSRAPSRSISTPSRAPSRSISAPSRSPSRSAPASRSTSRPR
ncbi:MAG: hypothetical protein JXR73_06815 [Candidatus Omnitrophica bacterium]|nr:hypothetical protein [Candidatus Omnitrophota bacterium]